MSKVVSTTADMIEGLKLYERAILKERAPDFKKWRAIQVQKTEWSDNDHMIFKPIDTSINWQHVVYEKSEEAKNIPQRFNRDGGWIVFNGIYVTSFWTNDDFATKFREVQCEYIEVTKTIPCHVVTKVAMPEGSSMVQVYTKGEEGKEDACWLFTPQIFRTLNPRVGDLITYDLNKQYQVIPSEEVEVISSMSPEDRERLADAIEDFYRKEEKPQQKHNKNQAKK